MVKSLRTLVRLGKRQRISQNVKRGHRDGWRMYAEGYTRKQQIIARSSTEAELYAAVLGASDAKRMVSLLRDLGYAKTHALVIDAKATGHVLHQTNEAH